MGTLKKVVTESIVYEKGKLYELPLASVQPDPEQPRKYFDEQALAELSASIASHGVLQPILVREGMEGVFIIVSGERRYQAAKNAGMEIIPAILTDGEPAEISIIENLLRENLTAIEEAEAIERLRAQHDYALGDLATALGKSDSTLSEILSLNKLPPEVKDDCRNDPKAGRSILALIARQKTPEKMTALYTKYKESGLTRGEIRKRTAKPKTADAAIDLAFVDQFYDRLFTLDETKLSADQKTTLNVTLVKLRGMVYQKMKLLK
jgi:ParB family transcriptional regulator, chromosome partitioning protein